MPLPRHQVLIQIVAAVPSRLSLYSDEPMPFSAVEPQHRHSIDFVTLFGRGHCNTVRHGSRSTPMATQVANLGEEAVPGWGEHPRHRSPFGLGPAPHARFDLIHGVGQQYVTRARPAGQRQGPPCPTLALPLSLAVPPGGCSERLRRSGREAGSCRPIEGATLRPECPLSAHLARCLASPRRSVD